MASGHLKQVVAALALHPERGPLPGSPPRQQQRAGGVLPKPGGEER